MKKALYILALLSCCNYNSFAQSDSIKNKRIDLGLETIKEENKTQAVSTVDEKELDKNSAFSSYDILFGVLPGLTALQNTGWESLGSRLNIRGRGSLNGAAPLVVVDGFVRKMEFIDPKEIASISVLKDGAATALWGGRGANGVIVVTTKRGQYNKRSIEVNYNYGVGLPVKQPHFANSVAYAKAYNEALVNDGMAPIMNVEGFEKGTPTDLYPNVDWMDEALSSHTDRHQLDVVFRGGGKNLRYFTSFNYKYDNGILNSKYTDMSGRFNSQYRKYFLNLRMNIDADITSKTKLKLGMLGVLRETKRPNTGEASLFSTIYNTPSAAFPVKTVNGIWSSNDVFKVNPLAQIGDMGYYQLNTRMLQADMRLLQDLSDVMKGLNMELAVAYDNNAVYQELGSRGYMYQTVAQKNDGSIAYTNHGNQNDELKITNGGLQNQYIQTNAEAKLNYSENWSKHHLNLSALFRYEGLILSGVNTNRYREYLLGTANYNYDNRYFVDVVANYFGTSVLGKNDKFRFYPAISGAWMISNEKFLHKYHSLNMLRLRASYGCSGFDVYDYDQDKQFWIGKGSYLLGAGNVSAGASFKEDALAMHKLDLEKGNKYNVGLDARMFNHLDVAADIFFDYRSNILVGGKHMVSSVIGLDAPNMNIGKVDTKGLELSAMWRDRVKAFTYYVGANLSYAKSKVVENGEGYLPYSYLSAKGYPLGQVFGWEAIGYFNDEDDIQNSPLQKFSEVRPGDVKYRDLNGDNVIDEYDKKAIGHSSLMPELYYGIQLGFEYKGFGVDALFQGIGNYSVMLNTPSVYWPLRNNTNISSWYLSDHDRWTIDNKECADLPRLTTKDNANNFRNSTQWLENGRYFKLRNLNIYYNIPERWLKSLKMNKMQLYVRANNLFSIDKVKYLNVESLKVGYPDMTELYFGVNLKF